MDPGAPELPRDYLLARYASDSSQFLTLADGTLVHYRDQGLRDGRVILLLHGAWSSLHAFEPWVAELEDRYRLVSLDLPAHGLTGPSPTLGDGPQDGVLLIDEVLAALEIESAVFAGSSLGGQIAWRFALEQPGAVEALVLIDAAGAPPRLDPEIERGLGFLRIPGAWRFAARVPQRQTVAGGAAFTYANREIITDALIDRTWELMRYPGTARAFAKAFARWPAHDRRAARLAGLEIPTLILWGREDRFIPLAAGEWFAATIPGAELIVYDGVGHAPMEEAPERSAADLAAFLERAGR